VHRLIPLQSQSQLTQVNTSSHPASLLNGSSEMLVFNDRHRRRNWITFDDENDDVKKCHDKIAQCVQVTKQDLQRNLELLRCCGFYYERSTHTPEMLSRLLDKSQPGTFLVRDSQDPNYLFTIGLQTERGPTSVRLVYIDGLFRLDAADQRLIGTLPGFSTVVNLVQHYVEQGKRSINRKSQVWIDTVTGRTHSQVNLQRPLIIHVPTLKHVSRLALNKLPSSDDEKKVPDAVQRFIEAYPNHV